MISKGQFDDRRLMGHRTEFVEQRQTFLEVLGRVIGPMGLPISGQESVKYGRGRLWQAEIAPGLLPARFERVHGRKVFKECS